MRFNRHWITILLLAACLPLTSCRKMNEEEEVENTAAKVEHINGEDAPAQITLTEDAEKRIDVHTATVEEVAADGAKQKSIPFAALLYDPEGATWAFANTRPLVYIRQPVKVTHIVGDKAFLSEGPDIGTKVVTVGAAQLYGSEIEFEEE